MKDQGTMKEAQMCKAESGEKEQVEGGASREGMKDCLNHRLRKKGQGCSPQGGDQIFSGSTKDQPNINYTEETS
jgi:hypothetical protein